MPVFWIFSLLGLLTGSYIFNIDEGMVIMDEICDNAFDDDGDGLIDLNDPDCSCELVNTESLIPNPSFEDFDCCPDNDGELDCAVGWSQASLASTDFAHECGYLSTASAMMPFPDGEGAVIFLDGSVMEGNSVSVYKEYAGVCLNSPMEKDSLYTIKFHVGFLDETNSPNLNFTFFGSSSCDNLPFARDVDCPTNYPEWHFLASKATEPIMDSPHWIELSIDLKPGLDINSLVMGGPCDHDFTGFLGIYFLDNLRLNDKSTFDFDVITVDSPCSDDYVFAVQENPDFSYQWYREGIALVGESNAKISQMYGEGFYQLRIVNNLTQECRFADDFEYTIPFFESEDFQRLCVGGSLLYNNEEIVEAGIYEFSFTSVDGCDSLVTLTVEELPIENDTIFAKTLVGTSYTIGRDEFMNEGEYEVNLFTDRGCERKVTLFLEHVNIFIPNVFSPNGDGNNDYFEIFTISESIATIDMSIYDRWGNLIFNGKKWDGTSENKFVNPGVFIYNINVITNDNETINFSGSITVIR